MKTNVPEPGKQDESMSNVVKQIQYHASCIFELMAPGMSMDISFPDNNSLVVPGKARPMHRLIIQRPVLVIKVMPK